MTTTPYNNLTPSLILDAIETLGFHCDGSLIALNSFENRVYQIGIEDESPLIVKFYRPQRWSDEAINEEHQFALELVEHEIPVIAPMMIHDKMLHTYADYRFAVFPRRGGRALELDNIEQLQWMGRFLGRLHAVGACKPFNNRITLDVQTYGYQPYEFLIANDFIPLELKPNYCMTVVAILEKINVRFQGIESLRYLRIHGDCHAGNVLWNTQGPQIVDLDDCLMGPAIQDMWMLLSGGTQVECEAQLEIILQEYLIFHDFDYRELQLIEPLRTLRMIHYSAWLAKRWEDPAFPLSFPWFNTVRYWQDQLQHLRDQLSLLDEYENYD